MDGDTETSWIRERACREEERGTCQDGAWVPLGHPKLHLAGVAGVRRGEGAVEGTGTVQRWGGLPCTCNNKLRAQGLTVGRGRVGVTAPGGDPGGLVPGKHL